MPELRYDAFSSSVSGAPDQAFIKNNGTPINNTFTGLIAATYTF
jgi:hypothetical protein